jgi:hypothetical protein
MKIRKYREFDKSIYKCKMFYCNRLKYRRTNNWSKYYIIKRMRKFNKNNDLLFSDLNMLEDEYKHGNNFLASK